MDFFQLLFVYDVQFQLKGIGITTGVGDILFDREKTFLTDVMLHLTGILRGCFRSDAETDRASRGEEHDAHKSLGRSLCQDRST